MDQHEASRRDFLKASVAVAAASGIPLQRSLADSRAESALSIELATHPGRALLRPDLSRALDVRVLAKPVYSELVIDDMEQDGRWIASRVVTLQYTIERFKKGTRSMRFQTLLRNEDYINSARRKNGSFTGSDVSFDGMPFSASARLAFDTPQDWSAFNRISLWCYRHPNGNPTSSLSIGFVCQGANAGPADPVAIHYFADIEAEKWNKLTWEIPEMQRDRVVEVVLFQCCAGTPPLAGVSPEVIYDLDQLSLERVDAEVVEGWAVAPGKIAYSHIGYHPGATKIAICGDEGTERFTLLNASPGATAASFPTRRVANSRGRYLVLDFSAHVAPGSYRLQCGSARSEEFLIDASVWDRLFDLTLNAFYGFRCGCDIPGFHTPCHRDVTAEYKGEKRSLAGGWHDAANLTQGAGRTHLSVYALLRAYEQLVKRPDQKERAARVLEEALWGLDWSLRTRFAPGFRCYNVRVSYWTDSVTGNADDVVQDDTEIEDFQNTLGIIATAAWARICGRLDAALATRARVAAEEDYAHVTSRISAPPKDAKPFGINDGSWRDQIGYLTYAAVELFRLTGEARYRDDAFRFGRWLLAIQEQRFVGESTITGYFYEDAGRTRIVHEFHNSFEESGALALQALCDAFPDAPDWINWYAGVLLHSEYFCRSGAAAAAPFDMIPAAVWRRQDLDAGVPEDRLGKIIAEHPNPVFPTAPTAQLERGEMLTMWQAGAKLSDDVRLRRFPLWHNHIQHGASVVHLAKSAALAAAAQLRGSCDLAELAYRQIQWLVGANPFSRSIIYGVGYDYWQNFCVSMPDLVGGMSLGLNSYHDDSPAWGNNAVFPYKEQWIFSACRMTINLAQIGMSAELSGHAATAVALKDRRTGITYAMKPGRYRLVIPAGRYDLRFGDFESQLEIAPGRSYSLSFDPAAAIELQLSSAQSGDGSVALTVAVRGRGKHRISLRLFNCSTNATVRTADLQGDQAVTLSWQLSIGDPLKPWVVVAVPDDQLDARREAHGYLGGRHDPT